jgi:hypothetical protein
MYIENTSGHGEFADIPDEIKKWNWGAFWLTWIWGLFNKSYISLLALLPIANIIIPFYLGAKGNELAWQNRCWTDTQEFKAEQRAWSIGSWIIVFLLVLSLGFRIVNLNKVEKITTGITTEVLNSINANEEAKKILGENYTILVEPALQTFTSNEGEIPIAHTIFINVQNGLVLVHSSLNKDYSIREITISPPNDGKKITINAIGK